MLFREVQKNYIFPRIPLNLVIHESYPDIGSISDITVIPEVTNFKYSREELEIEGQYQLAVSYYKAVSEANNGPPELMELEYDNFFSNLKLEADGLFAENDEDESANIRKNSAELYTVHFTRQFHTYVDLEFISKPRSFKPGIVVEKAEITPDTVRNLKGELVLSLINKSRRH